jgi:hypothetical protein
MYFLGHDIFVTRIGARWYNEATLAHGRWLSDVFAFVTQVVKANTCVTAGAD